MKLIEYKCPSPRGECDSTTAWTSGTLAYCTKCCWHFRINSDKAKKKREQQKRWTEAYWKKHAVEVTCPSKDLRAECKGTFITTRFQKKKFCCPECRKAFFSVYGYKKKSVDNTGKKQTERPVGGNTPTGSTYL